MIWARGLAGLFPGGLRALPARVSWWELMGAVLAGGFGACWWLLGCWWLWPGGELGVGGAAAFAGAGRHAGSGTAGVVLLAVVPGGEDALVADGEQAGDP